MKETRVLQALEALAEQDRHLGASSSVETRLTHAFRARRTRRTKSWAAAGAIAMVAVVVIAAVVNRPQSVVSKPSALVVEAPLQVVAPPAPPIIAKHIRKRAPIEAAPAREIVTDFFPLMDPAPPFDRGEILRVQLPATAMRAVGLPVADDHLADQIQADVLVGEEGLPRAIRFVKFEMK